MRNPAREFAQNTDRLVIWLHINVYIRILSSTVHLNINVLESYQYYAKIGYEDLCQ